MAAFSQRRRQIGLAEIVAGQQKRHLEPMGQRVGKAIAKVEAAPMASLAKALKGVGRGIGQVLIPGHGENHLVVKKLLRSILPRLAQLHQCHQQNLCTRRGRDGQLRRTAEALQYSITARLTQQDRQHRTGVDSQVDHQAALSRRDRHRHSRGSGLCCAHPATAGSRRAPPARVGCLPLSGAPVALRQAAQHPAPGWPPGSSNDGGKRPLP